MVDRRCAGSDCQKYRMIFSTSSNLRSPIVLSRCWQWVLYITMNALACSRRTSAGSWPAGREVGAGEPSTSSHHCRWCGCTGVEWWKIRQLVCGCGRLTEAGRRGTTLPKGKGGSVYLLLSYQPEEYIEWVAVEWIG